MKLLYTFKDVCDWLANKKTDLSDHEGSVEKAVLWMANYFYAEFITEQWSVKDLARTLQQGSITGVSAADFSDWWVEHLANHYPESVEDLLVDVGLDPYEYITKIDDPSRERNAELDSPLDEIDEAIDQFVEKILNDFWVDDKPR